MRTFVPLLRGDFPDCPPTGCRDSLFGTAASVVGERGTVRIGLLILLWVALDMLWP